MGEMGRLIFISSGGTSHPPSLHFRTILSTTAAWDNPALPPFHRHHTYPERHRVVKENIVGPLTVPTDRRPRPSDES